MYLVADGRLIVEAIDAEAGRVPQVEPDTSPPLGGHLGNGLITLEGAEHRRHRRLMQPAMHGRGRRRFWPESWWIRPGVGPSPWPDGGTEPETAFGDG